MSMNIWMDKEDVIHKWNGILFSHKKKEIKTFAWIFIGRTDAEAEAPILWPPDAKSWLIGKDPDAGKDWRQEEKGATEDEMVGWHHRLDGHEFEQAPGVGDGQGSLACVQSIGSQRVGHDWMTELTDWMPFAATWMGLEMIILSEASQTEKDT